MGTQFPLTPANPGDITGVTAGTGLTGGGSSGAVSLALASPATTAGIAAPSGSAVVLTSSLPDGTGTQFQLNSDTQIASTNAETFLSINHKVSGVKTQLFGFEARVGGAPATWFTFFNPLTGAYENGIGAFGTDGGNDTRMTLKTKHLLPETTNYMSIGDYFYDYQIKYVASFRYGGIEQALATSGAVTFNSTSGEVGYLLATGNVTGLTITAPADSLQAQQVTLVLKQDSGGTSTWPSSITNALLSGGTLSKTTTANAVNVLSFRWCVALAKWVQVGTTTVVS